MNRSRFLAAVAVVLGALALVAAACSDSVDDSGAVGDGSLGTVRVRPGQAVQIRTLTVLTDDFGFSGLATYHRGAVFAVEDYGAVRGFPVEIEGFEEGCSPEGGRAAAQEVVADPAVVGVIGTACSAAATGASPLISAAGLSMISPSNSSPALTSDLLGNPSEHYHPGYYRTAQNDLYQGAAVADFLHDRLGLVRVAAVHAGDAYTQGLAQAFRDAYLGYGGTVTAFLEVDPEATDLSGVLAEVAAGAPEGLFVPVSRPLADHVVQQARSFDGLEGVVLVAADSVFNVPFFELEATKGIFVAGPDPRYGANSNQVTGKSAEEVTQRYIDTTGQPPIKAFWAHSYDAATLLLKAITAASWIDDGVLVIDRAGIREYLDQVSGFQGIIGEITCDEFGDCGPAAMTIIENLDPANAAASLDNVVYEYQPVRGQRPEPADHD